MRPICLAALAIVWPLHTTEPAIASRGTLDRSAVNAARSRQDAGKGESLFSARLLARGTFQYKGELGPPSKAAPTTTVLTVRDAADGVSVTEAIELPGGRAASEEMTLDPQTLAVRRRIIRFGDRVTDLTFSRSGVRGSSTSQGTTTPIEFALDAELFADGGGAFAVLGALPLSIGFTHTFQNLDIANRRTSRHVVAVKSIETVTVDAGTFEAFRLELTNDPPTPQGRVVVWIDVTSRTLLRMDSANARYQLARR